MSLRNAAIKTVFGWQISLDVRSRKSGSRGAALATVVTEANPTIPPRQPRRTAEIARLDRIFFSAMPILFLSIVLFGFAQTYFLAGIVPLPHWKHAFAGPHPRIVHVHGAVLTAWFILLIVQTRLIAARHVRLHRRLGYAGMALAALVVIVGFLVDCEHLARAFPLGDRKIVTGGGNLAVLFDVLIFGVLVGLAYFYRRNPAAHKRLMLIGTIAILPPAIARSSQLILSHFWLLAVGTAYALILIIVLYDVISRRRVHPATIGGGVFYVLLMNFGLSQVLAANEGWWFDLALQAQNFGRHLY
jgi:hypothetical protein